MLRRGFSPHPVVRLRDAFQLRAQAVELRSSIAADRQLESISWTCSTLHYGASAEADVHRPLHLGWHGARPMGIIRPLKRSGGDTFLPEAPKALFGAEVGSDSRTRAKQMGRALANQF